MVAVAELAMVRAHAEILSDPLAVKVKLHSLIP